MPFIYALIDPITNRVRYIGKSNNPERRYYAHIGARKGLSNRHKNRWINKLLEQGKRPILHVLEICADDEWKDRERYWIAKYRKKNNDLLNISDGGDQTVLSDEARQAARDALIRHYARASGIKLKKCFGCGHPTVAYSSICKKCLAKLSNDGDAEWAKFYLYDYSREVNAYRLIDKYEEQIGDEKLDELLVDASFYGIYPKRL